MSLFTVYPDLQDFAARLRRLDDDPAKLTLVVAMTARTGSTQFCALLGAAGGFAAPDEIFNARSWVAHAAKARHGAADFAGLMAAMRAAPGPCCGLKTNWMDFAPVAKFHGNLLPGARFIYLDRRDVLAQAVSLFRAVVSGRWHVARGDGLDEQQAKAERDRLALCFDLEVILQTVTQLEREKLAWEQFFERESIAPVRVYYEDFVRDWRSEFERLSAALAVPLARELPADVGFEKIGDALSEEWLAQARRAAFMLS